VQPCRRPPRTRTRTRRWLASPLPPRPLDGSYRAAMFDRSTAAGHGLDDGDPAPGQHERRHPCSPPRQDAGQSGLLHRRVVATTIGCCEVARSGPAYCLFIFGVTVRHRGTGQCGRGTPRPGCRCRRFAGCRARPGRRPRRWCRRRSWPTRPPIEVGPQVLGRVELRGIGRQPLHGQPVALGVQMGAHLVAPVRAHPVPQQQHLLAGVETLELLQHADEAVGIEAVGLQVSGPPSPRLQQNFWSQA
jgi:hypothetical protein